MTERTARPSAAGTTGADEPLALIACVLLLNVATGMVEAITFAHLGGVFAAFVTGTVVLAGLRLATGGLAELGPYGLAFGGFAIGSVVGGLLIGSSHGDRRRSVWRTLIGETLILSGAAAATLAPLWGGPLALVLLALAMAVQFSATKRIGLREVGFAAVTGILHGLVHDAAVRQGRRVPRRVLAVVALLIGAFVGGLVGLVQVAVAISLAALLVLGAAALFEVADRGTPRAEEMPEQSSRAR